MSNGAYKLSTIDQENEMKRVRKAVYKSKKHSVGFFSSKSLAEWWINQLKTQDGCCFYCNTPIELIRTLITNKLLSGRKVKGEGIRGLYLELEKMKPKAGYNPTNCVLICYYCNNDKSNVYSYEEYKEFLAPAKKKHFMYLSKKLDSK
jgi:5-methylcytosine-specific restriction endonuclease McrA